MALIQVGMYLATQTTSSSIQTSLTRAFRDNIVPRRRVTSPFKPFGYHQQHTSIGPVDVRPVSQIRHLEKPHADSTAGVSGPHVAKLKIFAPSESALKNGGF